MGPLGIRTNACAMVFGVRFEPPILTGSIIGLGLAERVYSTKFTTN
jgi:hypothetical protein